MTRFVPKALTRAAGRQGLKLQKAAPNIMFAAGIVGSITSTVLACRATLKLPKVLEGIQHDVHGADHNGLDDKDKVYIRVKGACEIGRLYAPAAVVGAISIGLLTKSHTTLTQRNAALMAAYATLERGFNEYRGRVREELGEEVENDIFLGIREEVQIVDGKKVNGVVLDKLRPSPYARLFDDYNVNWTKDPEVNRIFVECQQRYMNDLLKARGHVFLNEAYDALGLDRSSIGAIVGWVLNDDGGDNFVDFGIYLARNRDFLEGHERSILLDFNVDGIIYDKI